MRNGSPSLTAPAFTKTRRTKVLLVYPAATVRGLDPTSPSAVPVLGLGYIAAVLEQEGFEVQILEALALGIDKGPYDTDYAPDLMKTRRLEVGQVARFGLPEDDIRAYIWDDKPGQGERFANMTPPERLRAAIAEGERIHPGYAQEIESGVSRAWLKAPYQKGGWPESYKAPKRLREPDGAIYFAGDQVTALPGWQEGAALAAHSVVNAINERVAVY